jgi:hypothetical protein
MHGSAQQGIVGSANAMGLQFFNNGLWAECSFVTIYCLED